MNGTFSRAHIVLAMVVFGVSAYGQVPCPIALLDARADKDSIRLEFMNKGKLPVEQLSLACSPAGTNKFPNGTCHVETGITYPGAASWIKIDYVGAARHAVEIAVTQLRLGGGVLWQPTAGNRCKAIKVARKSQAT